MKIFGRWAGAISQVAFCCEATRGNVKRPARVDNLVSCLSQAHKADLLRFATVWQVIRFECLPQRTTWMKSRIAYRERFRRLG